VDASGAPSVTELLLAVAGRVDDDLLAWARELITVGEDGRAIELVTATLVAEQVALPPEVRAAIVQASRAVRSEIDAARALAPARPEVGCRHRFDPAPAGIAAGRITAALHPVLARQAAGCSLWLTWRLTPAGGAPGPLPHPVVLVELPGAEPALSADVLAYQVMTALERAGTPASVEVLGADDELHGYHREALRTARPVEQAGNTPKPQPTRQPVAAPVAAPVAPPAAAEPPRSGRRRAAGDTGGSRPRRQGPRPTPAGQGGDDVPRRRARPTPAGPAKAPAADAPAEPAAVHPPDAEQARPAASPRPAPAPVERPSPPCPLSGPLIQPLMAPLLDPTIDDDDPLGLSRIGVPPHRTSEPWDREWVTGSWSEQVVDLFDGRSPAPQPEPKPEPEPEPRPKPELAPAPPAAEPEIDAAGLGLRPESVSKLSATDRALLARLQAELGPRTRRMRAGVPGGESQNGRTEGHETPPEAG